MERLNKGRCTFARTSFQGGWGKTQEASICLAVLGLQSKEPRHGCVGGNKIKKKKGRGNRPFLIQRMDKGKDVRAFGDKGGEKRNLKKIRGGVRRVTLIFL